MATNITKEGKNGNLIKCSENTVTEKEKNDETNKNIQKINNCEEVETTKNVTKLLITQNNHEQNNIKLIENNGKLIQRLKKKYQNILNKIQSKNDKKCISECANKKKQEGEGRKEKKSVEQYEDDDCDNNKTKRKNTKCDGKISIKKRKKDTKKQFNKKCKKELKQNEKSTNSNKKQKKINNTKKNHKIQAIYKKCTE